MIPTENENGSVLFHHDSKKVTVKGAVISYHLGGGGSDDFGGDHLIFRRTEGGL